MVSAVVVVDISLPIDTTAHLHQDYYDLVIEGGSRCVCQCETGRRGRDTLVTHSLILTAGKIHMFDNRAIIVQAACRGEVQSPHYAYIAGRRPFLKNVCRKQRILIIMVHKNKILRRTRGTNRENGVKHTNEKGHKQ